MDDQKLSLNWSNFQDNLISTFGDLRHDTDFVDVTLACEDQSLNAHQVALSACSPFFKKMLKIYSHPHPLIYMRGVKFDHLFALMDFIYFGKVDIPQGSIEEFLLLADELEIKGLCEYFFKENEEDKLTGKREEPDQKASPRSPHETVIKYGNSNTEGKQEKSPNQAPSTKHYQHENMVNQEKPTKQNVGNFTAAENSSKQPKDEKKKGRNISNDLLEQIDLMIEKQQKVFSCNVCGYNSSNKGHVNEHVEKHIEGLEYPCNICTKVLRYFQLDYLSILMKSGRPPSSFWE